MGGGAGIGLPGLAYLMSVVCYMGFDPSPSDPELVLEDPFESEFCHFMGEVSFSEAQPDQTIRCSLTNTKYVYIYLFI